MLSHPFLISPPRPRRARDPRGQTLVEFALVLIPVVLLTLGLIDGIRVIFYYSQVQEAARQGARWGAVQVARQITGSSTTVGGDLSVRGNAPGTYCDVSRANPTCPAGAYALATSRVISTGAITPTIVGATLHTATAVDPAQVTVTISTTFPATATTEVTSTDPNFTGQTVTVTMTYPFKPVLGMVFNGVSIAIKGASSMLHE